MSDNTTAVVLASVGVAGGLHMAVELKERGRGPHHFPTIFGTFILAAALLLIGEFLPAVARGLALVILLTAVVMNGGKFFSLIASLAGARGVKRTLRPASVGVST